MVPLYLDHHSPIQVMQPLRLIGSPRPAEVQPQPMFGQLQLNSDSAEPTNLSTFSSRRFAYELSFRQNPPQLVGLRRPCWVVFSSDLPLKLCKPPFRQGPHDQLVRMGEARAASQGERHVRHFGRIHTRADAGRGADNTPGREGVFGCPVRENAPCFSGSNSCHLDPLSLLVQARCVI